MSDDLSWKVAVKAVRTYYTFLAADLGGIPSDSIVEPPVGGWRTINETTISGLGKTREVIELLRHLPYIKSNHDLSSKIAFETLAINYTDAYTQGLISANRIEGLFAPVGAGVIPPHVAVLSEGSRYGSWLLLDTKQGTVTDYIQQERPERNEPGPDSPDFWRAYKTLPVAEFFAQWEQNFRSLNWVVNPFDIDDGMMLRHDRRTDEVHQIYRDHGWPQNFRREECQQALKEWQDSENRLLLS